MTVETQIQNKIKELLHSINNSIPIEWVELYINVEMSSDGGSVYYDFKSENEEKFHYSLSIPHDFSVDEHVFDQYSNQQFNLGRELWSIFVDNNLSIWSSMVISYVKKKLYVKFDYTPWLDSLYGPTDRRNFFKYTYLNFQPRTENEAQKFEEMKEYQEQFNG